MLESWSVTKSKGACARCGYEFPPNSVFFSCLQKQQGDFVRCDFCRDCWDEKKGDSFFCFWRSRRAAPGQKQTVNTDLMLEFFERLDRPDSEKKRAFRFVLALYLTRRREMKLLGVERGDGVESLLFQRRSSGNKVLVENPDLTEEQIEETAAHLGRLLNADL